ncbi:predicted lysine transporter NhaC family [Photobacterium aphoticum]|uniref:Predicted lysine transporter NhaC family n=1 Tax=Photobacterium aphoticum TaxID=754436 RepID=A0A090QQR9_9GAMM|nr:predicted lysine transporter NhaC family [Photobacterium aphoticum]
MAIGYTHSAWIGVAVSGAWFVLFCLYAMRKNQPIMEMAKAQ